MRVVASVCVMTMLAAASVANAGIEIVERQFIITGQLDLNIVDPGDEPGLPTFSVLFGGSSGEQTCLIRRGTDPLTQEWDTVIQDYLTGINPLFEGEGEVQNPLHASPNTSFYPSPLNGQYETDAAGRTTSYMGGVFTLEWAANGQSLTAVGISDHVWSWTPTTSFGDESFTAVLGSPIQMQWSNPELGAELPSITILEGSTLTFTLVPGPGAGVMLAGAATFAARRRR